MQTTEILTESGRRKLEVERRQKLRPLSQRIYCAISRAKFSRFAGVVELYKYRNGYLFFQCMMHTFIEIDFG